MSIGLADMEIWGLDWAVSTDEVLWPIHRSTPPPSSRDGDVAIVEADAPTGLLSEDGHCDLGLFDLSTTISHARKACGDTTLMERVDKGADNPKTVLVPTVERHNDSEVPTSSLTRSAPVTVTPSTADKTNKNSKKTPHTRSKKNTPHNSGNQHRVQHQPPSNNGGGCPPHYSQATRTPPTNDSGGHSVTVNSNSSARFVVVPPSSACQPLPQPQQQQQQVYFLAQPQMGASTHLSQAVVYSSPYGAYPPSPGVQYIPSQATVQPQPQLAQQQQQPFANMIAPNYPQQYQCYCVQNSAGVTAVAPMTFSPLQQPYGGGPQHYQPSEQQQICVVAPTFQQPQQYGPSGPGGYPPVWGAVTH